MTTKVRLNVVFGALMAVVLAAPAGAQSGGGRARVEGTWDIVISVPDEGLQLAERVTFTAGRSANEGAAISTNALDSFACSAAQGAWVRTGKREFAVTVTAFCFDTESTPPGEPFGSIISREVVSVDETGNALTGRGAIEFFGPDGASQGVTAYTLTGSRMGVEQPPSAPGRAGRWK
jgi:hypothetical protein